MPVGRSYCKCESDTPPFDSCLLISAACAVFDWAQIMAGVVFDHSCSCCDNAASLQRVHQPVCSMGTPTSATTHVPPPPLSSPKCRCARSPKANKDGRGTLVYLQCCRASASYFSACPPNQRKSIPTHVSPRVAAPAVPRQRRMAAASRSRPAGRSSFCCWARPLIWATARAPRRTANPAGRPSTWTGALTN